MAGYYAVGEPDTIRVPKLNTDHALISEAVGSAVSSFNGRAGAVTLISSDVTTALSFTPLSSSNNLSDVSSATTSRANLGITGGFTAVAVDRTALSNLATTHVAAYLKEAGREGTFVWDSSNNSANVTADTAQATYVAPISDATGASGAWVRKFSGAKDARWYGAKGDTTTDDAVALQAWLDAGGLRYLPSGGYRTSVLLKNRRQGKIYGGPLGFDARLSNTAMPGSRILPDAGIGGFDNQPQSTITDVATALAAIAGGTFVTQEGAYGAVIEDIAFIGANAGATATGFYSRTLCYLKNVFVQQFTGKGFDLSASADTPDGNSEYGNLSTSSLTNCSAKSNGSHGYHLRGRDVNTCQIQNCSSASNGGWGFLDESFLGNYYAKPHTTSNTLGAIKAVGTVSNCTFEDPYIEGGGNTQIGPACTIIGNDLTASNTSPSAPPATYASTLTNIQKLKFGWNFSSPGAISNCAWLFRAANEGLWIQGEGSSSDISFVNKSGNVTASNNTGTKDWTYKGYVSLNGADPIFTLNGSGDAVGSQFLMGFNGTILSQIYQSSGSTYISSDSIIFRDHGTLVNMRFTIDSTGINLASGKALSYAGTTVISGGVLTAAGFPVLTGDVTTPGTSLATTIAAGVVSLAKMANVATSTVFYRKTAGTGAPEVQTLATLKTDLGLTGTNSGDQTITLTGNVTGTGTGSFVTTIAAGAVTRAMMSNTSAATVLGSTAAGAVAELTAAQVKTFLAIAESDVTNLTTDLAAKAPLANPEFTGVAYYQQPAPTAKNSTTTLTIADLQTLIITSTSTTAVSLTLPTGTLTDAGILGGALVANEAFEWYLINLGSSSGAVTLVAGTAHTIVGSAVVAIGTSARFLTRKTATNTFVTYRIA